MRFHASSDRKANKETWKHHRECSLVKMKKRSRWLGEGCARRR